METPVNAPVKRRRTREDRRRTARACDRCRRLKERCEGGIPCSRCMHLRRTCEFKRLSSVDHDQSPVQVKSTAPEVNVHELLERVLYMERILKHKFEGIDLDLDSLRRMARAIDEHEQNNSSAPPDEDSIEDEVCTIDPVEDTTTHYSGEFSYWNFSMRVKRHIEDRMVYNSCFTYAQYQKLMAAQQTQDPLQVSNYWRAEQLHSGANSIAAAISCCPPRHIADFLINVFFKHAETYYYVLDKEWLTDKVDDLYNDRGRFGNKSAAVVSIVLTVFAIATQYAYLDSPTPKSAEFTEDALGTMFYQQAIRLLPEIIEASSLESVQACLLFAIYALPLDASGLGYIYITLTNRLGMQNGLHRRYTGTGLSAAMVEMRNRVWWTAYTLERKLSIFHGRPLSTHRFDVDAPLPTHRDDLQCEIIPYMVASIQLTQRLEELCREMYVCSLSVLSFATDECYRFLLRTCPKHERSSILSRLVDGKNSLEAWWKTLPDEVQAQKNVPYQQTNSHFRLYIHIRLEYCLVSMFIGRPLLLNRAASRSSPASPETQNSDNRAVTTSATNNHTKHRQQLVDSCIQAAKEALRLCSTLRNNGPGLARASYVEYSSCRGSLLALIARSIQGQSSQFQGELRQGLEMIREMAAAGDSARSEVAFLESLEHALARLQCANEADGTGNGDTPGSKSGADYEGFKQWETMWKSSGSTHPENMHSQWNPGLTSSGSQNHLDEHIPQSFRNGISSSMSHTEDMPNIHSPCSFDALPFDNGSLPVQPELRFLQEFLAMPGYTFDTGFGVDDSLDGLEGTGSSFPGSR
ncbi:transcription factor domain-containing protein [Aspergillus foveolatus]|uniref:transcription factor domain-containing protein n=1 Tax=Aspergillus foveolatus TaxID=210207 RepID=UPI003CCDF0D3